MTRITNPNSKDVEKYIEFLKKHYPKEQVDPIHVIKGELEETQDHEDQDEDYEYSTPHYIHIQKKDKNIESAVSGNFLQTGRGTSKRAIGFNSYTAPEKNIEGVVKLYGQLEKSIEKEAKNRGKVLDGVFVETDNPEAYKKLGYKKIQFKDGTHVKYVQPSLDYDKKGKGKTKPAELFIMVKPLEGLGKIDSKADKVEIDSKPIAMAFRRLATWYTPYEDEEAHYKDEHVKRDKKANIKIHNNITDLFKDSIERLEKEKKVYLVK